MSIPYPIRLTMSPDNEIMPVWSPDGQRIAFISQASSERQIYIVSADGADKQRIAAQFQVSPYSSLAWTQDGAKLLFQMTNNAGFHPFVMVDLESSERETFSTIELGENYTGCGSVWSDASQRLITNLAVETDCVSGGPPYLLALDNPVFHALTLDGNPALSSYSYDWTSEGKTLAFIRSTDPFGVTQQLYSLNLGSYEFQAITSPDDLSPDGTGGYQKISVEWSPDQHWLAFAWVFGEPLKRQVAIYVVASDGGELKQVSPILEDVSSVGGVAWRPS